MIVALPIEISVREFISKLFCVYKILKNTNYRVVLGKKSEVYNFYKKNRGIYLISKGGTINSFQFKNNISNNRLSILDEEGPLINFSYKSDFIARTNKEIMKKLSYYYCFGLADFNLMKTRVNKKKLIISGHPKYDLCHNKYKKIFDKEKKELSKKYGKFFLVASSFAAVDGYVNKKDYTKWIANSVENNLKKKMYKDLRSYFKYDQVYYDRLVKFTKKIAQQNPKINFIFRPHPRQDITKVKKNFNTKSIKNIFIIQEGSITPYIYASEFYLHSGCTTALEAALLKKKIVYLENNFKSANVLYKKFGLVVKPSDYSKVKDLINNNKKYNYKKDFIKKFIFNDNKCFFYKVLIKNLKKVNLKSSEIVKQTHKEKHFFLSRLKEIISSYPPLLNLASFFIKDILLSKEYTKSKFQKINIKEIEKKILFFQKLDNVKFNFKIKKVNLNSFIFEKL